MKFLAIVLGITAVVGAASLYAILAPCQNILARIFQM